MLPTIEPVDEQTIEVIPDGDRQANRGNWPNEARTSNETGQSTSVQKEGMA